MEHSRPIYPGEFILNVYMEPFKVKASELAESLDVDQATVSRLLVGDASVFPDMAIRLSVVLGGSSYFWLSMQSQYSLWLAEHQVDKSRLKQMVFSSHLVGIS
ncbi:HigA family addiction module antitoxin [Leptothoe spongobia]|uniref:HigA family addiction module antidote protein n=1 Tax=Leptothoe spongobia TAU-MAC 1115 TaxID=1967444 RepID=A0A947DCZ1_9CYAN|nr:HigA family addiction module antitoxin [Leptothoe spongobia]MBT9314209.1 HigA family addiction module antidote protein [Leptothoe spongobia TAU-MAC 1115]